VKRKGAPEETRTFSVEDAKRARLWGNAGPWSQYPWRMLQMRARGWALRDVFADALMGLMPREEVEDYQDEPEEVKPAEVVETPTDLSELAKTNQPKEFLTASESEDLQRWAQECYGEQWQGRLTELCQAVSKQDDPLRLTSGQCQMLIHGIKQKIHDRDSAGCNTEGE
jgi:hypothetical protein